MGVGFLRSDQKDDLMKSGFQSRQWVNKIAILAAILSVGVVTVFGTTSVRQRRLRSQRYYGFQAIHFGDKREKVESVVGKPDRVRIGTETLRSTYDGRTKLPATRNTSKKDYIYINESFFIDQMIIIGFDSDDRVVSRCLVD